MTDVRIESSFEILSQDEWDRYLGTDIFNDMRISDTDLGVFGNIFSNLFHPRLNEMIQEHNNKVGSLLISYALCKHYYDKGIPDDPWYISPGKDGQSVEYMPLFQEEHWMRKYWFNYFSDTYYLKISSVWDSMIEIINNFYSLDYVSDLRLRNNVLKWLKTNKANLYDIFNNIMTKKVYIDAQKYRTAAAHGISAGTVRNTVKTQNDVWTEVLALDVNGKPILDDNGKVTMKRVKASTVISMCVGDYTNVNTIMNNMEHYARFTGEKIKDIISLISVDNK